MRRTTGGGTPASRRGDNVDRTGSRMRCTTSTTAPDAQPDVRGGTRWPRRRHGEGALGFGAAVDRDLDEDEYTTAEDDPDDALLGQPSEADDAFFDSLFSFARRQRREAEEEASLEEGRGGVR